MVAPTVSNNVNEGRMCVRPGDAKDAIEEETTCASLLVSPPFANDTHGSSKTKQGIGEETSESYGKTSFLPVLRRMSRISHSAQGNLWQSVHAEGGQAVNPKVFFGSVPLSLIRA